MFSICNSCGLEKWIVLYNQKLMGCCKDCFDVRFDPKSLIFRYPDSSLREAVILSAYKVNAFAVDEYSFGKVMEFRQKMKRIYEFRWRLRG